jgi:hypothetical protein
MPAQMNMFGFKKTPNLLPRRTKCFPSLICAACENLKAASWCARTCTRHRPPLRSAGRLLLLTRSHSRLPHVCCTALSSSSKSLVANPGSPCQGSALADGDSVLHGLRLQAPLSDQAAIPWCLALLWTRSAALWSNSSRINHKMRRFETPTLVAQPRILPQPWALQGSAESTRT